MRPRSQVFTGLIALAAFGPLVGCASLADLEYESCQKLRAWHAFHDYKATCNAPTSMDYACGWKSGFYDVATGGNGCPPLTAPARYWKPGQILAHCDKDRKQWYVGFQDGAAYASRFPDTHYLKLWTPPCQPCGGQTDGCQPSVCHPPTCQAHEEIIEVDEVYPLAPQPAAELPPSSGADLEAESDMPPAPVEQPMPLESPAEPAEESAPAPPVEPTPESVSPPSADGGFQILGPLDDIDLTETEPSPFIRQNGSQIILVSATNASSRNQLMPGRTQ